MLLAKPEPGQPILVTIGAKRMELRFPLGVLKQLQRDHDISMLKGTTFGDVITSPEKLALLLYFGLKTEQPDITQEWVDNNVDASMLVMLSPYIGYAMTGRWLSKYVRALTADDDEETPAPNFPPPPPTGTPTGLLSGPSGAMTSGLVNGKSGE
jgi:hypothetical protein